MCEFPKQWCYDNNSVWFTSLDVLKDHRKNISWRKHCSQTSKKFICWLYHSTSENDKEDLILYLGQNPPFAVIILGLKLILQFAQLVEFFWIFSVSHQANWWLAVEYYYLFLATSPQLFTVDILFPVSISNDAMIKVTYSTHIGKNELPLSKTIWHYKPADWEKIRDYFDAYP